MSSPRSPQSPKYCRDKTHDLAYVRLTGRKHYLGKYGSPESRQLYREKIGEWCRGPEAPNPKQQDKDDSATMTVLMLIAAWIKHHVPTRSEGQRPNGEAGRFFDLFREMKLLFGAEEHLAIHFGAKSLKKLAAHLADVRGFSRRTVRGYVLNAKTLFRWAVEEDLLPGEVSYRIDSVKRLRYGQVRKKVRPMADELVEAIKPFLSRHVRAMVDVQMLTGMRSGELTGMRRSRVDTSGPSWVYQLGTEHKTGHHDIEREIEIGPAAQEVLKQFPPYSLDPDEFIFSPTEAEKERADAGPCRGTGGRKPGKRYTPDSYRKAIQEACKKAFPLPEDLRRRKCVPSESHVRIVMRWETPKEWRERLGPEGLAKVRAWRKSHRFHPHQIRHYAATRIERRFGRDAAQVVMGHQSPAVTNLYIEQDRQLAKKVMLEIG